MPDRQMPLVISEGLPFARGLHLGRAQATRVRQTVSAYLELFQVRARLDHAGVLTTAERFIPAIEAYAPHLLEEMRGIAEGSGHDLRAIVAINSRTELMYGVPFGECTAIGVTPEASADGHLRQAQNWDWKASLSGALVLWVIRREDGPDVLTLTEAGMVGKIGVNASGFAMFANGTVHFMGEPVAAVVAESEAEANIFGIRSNHCHITDNFAVGLFQCYDVEGLPRTNNELEHCFGIARVHERRATGRRGAIPGVVVRGSVRVMAAVLTKQQIFSAEELRPRDHQHWRDLRRRLQQREEGRRHQFRFRKDPATYLAALEAQLLQ